MLSRERVQQLCKKSLESIPLGLKDEEWQNGIDFYKYMFTNHPDLRVYFKGAENYTAEDVQKSERFKKQGTRILLAQFICANTYSDPVAFEAFARETTDRHRIYKMDPALWHAFWTVFVNYLCTKTTVDEETKQAWAQLGKDFGDECLAHLKRTGRAY
uniref:Globin family profile domain-containing protein n=1 Tax=Panagrolaimus superbus TaxID=310955 RepID=A0A914XT33_9BILA